MKPLSIGELDLISEALQTLVGSPLRELYTSDSDLILGFYKGGHTFWLWIDLTPKMPAILYFRDLPTNPPKKIKPLLLFARSNLRGRILVSVERNQALGRVLEFSFQGTNEKGEPDLAQLEVRLFPHGQNVLVSANEKNMSWNKPRTIETKASSGGGVVNESPRSLEALRQEWLTQRGFGSFQKSVSGTSLQDKNKIQENEKGRDSAADLQKPSLPLAAEKLLLPFEKWTLEIERKLKHLSQANQRLHLEIKKISEKKWREVGEELKMAQSLRLDEKWQSYLLMDRSLAENIKQCFEQAREQDRRVEGIQARIATMNEQIKHGEGLLQRCLFLTSAPNFQGPEEDRPAPGLKTLEREVLQFIGKSDGRSPKSERPSSNLKSKIEAGVSRRFKLSEDVEIYWGKNAQENLKLLRSAQAWDYWLHLRDFPSTHAIIRRPRSKEITDSDFRKAGLLVMRESPKVSRHFQTGDAFDLVVAECRYVRPIKGDKAGRVNYQNERILRLRWQENAD